MDGRSRWVNRSQKRQTDGWQVQMGVRRGRLMGGRSRWVNRSQKRQTDGRQVQMGEQESE